MEQKPTTEKDVEDMITELGVPTGSRAWGVQSYDSDYDYMFDVNTYPMVLDAINSHIKRDCISKSDYFVGMYVTINDKRYNLFILAPNEYMTWCLATDAMQRICGNDDIKEIIKDKKNRVNMFENLCSTIKMGKSNKISKDRLSVVIENLKTEIIRLQQEVKKKPYNNNCTPYWTATNTNLPF